MSAIFGYKANRSAKEAVDKDTFDAHGHALTDDTITDVLPITKGGTGGETVAAARKALGLGNTSGAVPVANGGTGATTAAAARTALGITPANIGALTTGGTAHSAARLASDVIVHATTSVELAEIAAGGYISQQTIKPTTIDGYTPIGVISVQSNSSYVLPYYYLLTTATNIGYSVRNLSESAITPTLKFHVLYVKTA